MTKKKIIIVAHKNILRALFSHFQNINEENIKNFSIPSSSPMVFEFDKELNHINNYVLLDYDAHSVRKNNPNLTNNHILINHTN
jgi:bisphosphoglycerate-dependent phosphoglycerate mutase